MKKEFEINGKVFKTTTESINPIESLMDDSNTRLVNVENVGYCPAPRKNDYFQRYLEGRN